MVAIRIITIPWRIELIIIAISVNISVDAYGLLNDYIRKNSDWEQVKENILKANSKVSENFQIEIWSTISALNIMKIHELENWCNSHNLKLSFGIVDSPDYLSVDSVPVLSAVQTNNVGILNLIKNSTFSQTKYNDLKRFLEFYDSTHHLKFENFYDW